MVKLFIDWYRRCFDDPNAASLMIVIIVFFLSLYFFHSVLSPLLIAIVFSYLLEKPVNILIDYCGVPRIFAIIVLLALFLALMLIVIAILFPLIWQQIVGLVTSLPTMLTSLNHYTTTLPQRYPELLQITFFDNIIDNLKTRAIQNSNSILQFSITSVLSFISIIINMVLIPIIVFFLLKDKKIIMQYCLQFLPKNRVLMKKVANEMNKQVSNYITSTFLQIVILTIMVYIPFWFFDLDYGLLLALVVGCTVIIPYIGIFIISILVVLIALFQWGLGTDFAYLVFFYLVVLLIECNIVVPILFSEALDLHPLVIILAIVIFGGLWGFWGVFFSIPLATLIKAIINVWPTRESVTK